MSDAEETEVINNPDQPGKASALSSQRLMVVALVVAVLAVAAAGFWWWRSEHSSPGDDKVADAKAKVCTQSAAVRQGVVINTHQQNPVPDDPIGGLAVAANARLALLGGGAYLHELVAETPATPSELADAVTAMASTLEELGVSYLAGQPNEAQVPLRQNLDGQLQRVGELCQK